jgi:hypothetical protein
MTLIRSGLALTAAGTIALCSTTASAQTFTAGCSNGAGDPGALVSAIDAANGAPGPDTVELGAGCVYRFVQRDAIWYGAEALPPIASDVTIEGHGATIARDPGSPPFRLFFVGADPARAGSENDVSPGAGVLTLRDVTLTGGLAKGGDALRGGGGAGMGGAIFNQGTVVVERSTLFADTAQGGSSTNPAAGASGGGIGGNGHDDVGGGFAATSAFEGGVGGVGGPLGGGGGAGLRLGENGRAGDSAGQGAGGGPATGLGGTGGAALNAGDGSGGGGSAGTAGSGHGGGFGAGGGSGGGGGGVGGGGGSSGSGGAGGGGFGAGGGATSGVGSTGGAGGFGGGGGGGAAGAAGGAPGFGGGSPSGTQGGGGAGMGGAIFNMQGRLTIRDSTLTKNAAVGGVDNVPDHAKGIGGAVFNLSGSVTVDGATLAANTAAYDGESIYNLVYDASTARTALTSLRDTIVAGSTPTVVVASSKTAYISAPNLGGATVDAGHFDLVTSMAAREQGTILGSPLGADPGLGALRDNGGPTRTMAPEAGSPAIDAGSAFGLTTDQRGAPRPSNFAAIPDAGDGSDIGAFESRAPGGSGAGSGSGSTSGGGKRAFGKRTRVTLRLSATRIPARGPLRVIVVNANHFTISARLSGTTSARPYLTLGPRSLKVKATTKATVKLALSKRLRARFARRRRIAVRLRATVRDPAGHRRTVTKAVVVRLRRR